ncbi:MAG TPA: DsbE family thiol:disulfide interchange protein [Steroidobacteraceae bacterium]|nr:DsbE family thiol:disulfide interchange protein [Steroidobacteraceae bacterium]
MNRFAIPLALFAALVLVFAVALKRAPEKQFVRSALIGKPAAEFTLPDLMNPGGTVDSRSFKGKWVLLNVWGTWCYECRAENPQLLAIRQAGRVAVVGLNYKDEDEAARKWLKELGNPFDAVAVDKEGRVAIDYGVYGAPETFLINPQGIIVHKVVSVITPDLWQTQLLPMIEGRAK